MSRMLHEIEMMGGGGAVVSAQIVEHVLSLF